jgi:sugar phosphate isomerase/epimerase
VPPKALRAMLDRHGLVAPSAHVDPAQLRTAPEPLLDAAAALGHRWVIVAWLPPAEHRTVEAWSRRAEEFNRFGELAKSRGLRFAYHNHDFEFAPLDRGIGMDALLAGTDPALVDFELDLFWIAKAGHDPIAYLRKANGRIPMVHVKDMDASPERRMVDVGAGSLPFARIFAAGAALGLKHWFVEHDEPRDPFATAATSFRYLDALRW